MKKDLDRIKNYTFFLFLEMGVFYTSIIVFFFFTEKTIFNAFLFTCSMLFCLLLSNKTDKDMDEHEEELKEKIK